MDAELRPVRDGSSTHGFYWEIKRSEPTSTRSSGSKLVQKQESNVEKSKINLISNKRQIKKELNSMETIKGKKINIKVLKLQ